jgi:hypothetical protein
MRPQHKRTKPKRRQSGGPGADPSGTARAKTKDLPVNQTAESYHDPTNLKSLGCNIDRRSGSSGPDFALESAQQRTAKVVGARVAGPSHCSGPFASRLQSNIRPERVSSPIDFTLKRRCTLDGCRIFIKIKDRSHWGSGRPRGPRRPCRK